VDSPEDILVAVSGKYTVEKVTESADIYLFLFCNPTPVTINADYPEGISSVTLLKSDVKSYSEDGKVVSISFVDGKTASLQFSAWLSVKFDTDSVFFDDDLSPKELSFDVLENSSDSLSVSVDGGNGWFSCEPSIELNRKAGRVVFYPVWDKYYSSSITVNVSNGKKTVSQNITVSRVDFKFEDNRLSKDFSFPEYERYFELGMHCADTTVSVIVSPECCDWLKAKVITSNVDGQDRTNVCVLLSENKSNILREVTLLVVKENYPIELPITIKQIGYGMDGSFKKGLEDFFKNLHGESWYRHDNWCTEKPFFEWYGISASLVTNKSLFGDEGQVYFGTDDVWILNLAANNMRGTIPASFWKACKYFESIRISSEYLPDSVVPDCIWHDKLYLLDLSTSFMKVPLTSAVGNATSLRYLDLQLCSANCQIPEAITKLSSLRELNLKECSLNGSLPSALGDMASLENLILDHNMELCGELPSSFYQLENLRIFDVSATKICGVLTGDIRKLMRLENFNVSGCEFEGKIPEEFGTLENLCVYDFQGNYFEAIPEFIRYYGFNSKSCKQWVGSAGFPLGIPYFQRQKADGRPENYVVTVPDAFELSEILVNGQPIRRPGYYVDYTRCRQLPFPIWAREKYGLFSWETGREYEMKFPKYPAADDLQYPANEYYFDGKDWRHLKLSHPAREYYRAGNEWVHDPSCLWNQEYRE